MKRYLITTSDEHTWKFDRPVLFLGEWCRNYNRKNIWSTMDAVVADPFGLSPENKVNHLEYTDQLVNTLLEELTQSLNLFHKTNHSKRYWHILLGPWLIRYVEVLFNRYFSIQVALNKYEISGTSIYNSDDFIFATNDTDSFMLVCRDNQWNHFLYASILKFLNPNNLSFEVISHTNNNSIKRKSSDFNNKNLKQNIFKFISKLLSWFNKKNDAFIINTYLPKNEEIKLQILLGQCPQLWRSPPLLDSEFSAEKRSRFYLSHKGHTGFEYFIRMSLIHFIPICLIEGYISNHEQIQQLPWPKAPKFIFTST